MKKLKKKITNVLLHPNTMKCHTKYNNKEINHIHKSTHLYTTALNSCIGMYYDLMKPKLNFAPTNQRIHLTKTNK